MLVIARNSPLQSQTFSCICIFVPPSSSSSSRAASSSSSSSPSSSSSSPPLPSPSPSPSWSSSHHGFKIKIIISIPICIIVSITIIIIISIFHSCTCSVSCHLHQQHLLRPHTQIDIHASAIVTTYSPVRFGAPPWSWDRRPLPDEFAPLVDPFAREWLPERWSPWCRTFIPRSPEPPWNGRSTRVWTSSVCHVWLQAQVPLLAIRKTSATGKLAASAMLA